MDIKSLLLVGAAGWIGTKVSKLPSKIINMIFYFFSYTVNTLSLNDTGYGNLNTFIVDNIKSKSILKKMRYDEVYVNDAFIQVRTLPIGFCFEFKDNCLYIYNHIKMEGGSNSKVVFSITVSIIGLKKHALCKFEELNNIIAPYQNGCVKVYSGFNSIHVPNRSMDTVFLNEKNKLIDSIESWIKSKELFKKLGRPYKHGILLHGKPGTGKSSIIRGLATKYKRDICILTPNALKKNKIMDIAKYIRPNTILVIEEIDLLCNIDRKKEDGDTKENNAMYKLLNILDGLFSKENIICIATTNHLEKLDEALIRNGRFDLKIEVDDLNEETIQEMCDYYNVDRKIITTTKGSEVQSQIFEVLKDGNNN